MSVLDLLTWNNFQVVNDKIKVCNSGSSILLLKIAYVYIIDCVITYYILERFKGNGNISCL